MRVDVFEAQVIMETLADRAQAKERLGEIKMGLEYKVEKLESQITGFKFAISEITNFVPGDLHRSRQPKAKPRRMPKKRISR